MNEWEGFHSAWANTIVRHLNGGLLPPGYRASPYVHLGPFVEADIAAFSRERAVDPGMPSGGTASHGSPEISWSPPQGAVQTLEIELPAQDVFEVRIHDDQRGRRVVAAIELVSPGNKDRDDTRQAFVTKSAAYLQEQVNLVIVDIVTSRSMRICIADLLENGGLAWGTNSADDDLYCVAYRNRKQQKKWHLDFVPFKLAIGSPCRRRRSGSPPT